jgi:hypothetical protein
LSGSMSATEILGSSCMALSSTHEYSRADKTGLSLVANRQCGRIAMELQRQSA